MLMYALRPQNPSTWRFVTIMPATNPDMITVRIRRTGGGNRNIGIDRPTVDVDVFGPKAQVGNVSVAARTVQSQILSLMSAVVPNGVIQHTSTITGPRQFPEVNQNYVRYSATYEMQIHS
jgi:hypothetical protein